MKQNFKYLLFLPVFAIIVALSSWYDGQTTAKTADGIATGAINYADADAPDFSGTGDYATFDYRKDTLTNAGTANLFIGRRDNTVWNTVTTPTNFLSLYSYDIKVRPVSLSGTQSVKVVLDASNTRTGTSTDWTAIDSTTATVSAKVFQLRSTDATAARYRLRIIGAGTQSSTYQIWSIWKKRN